MAISITDILALVKELISDGDKLAVLNFRLPKPCIPLQNCCAIFPFQRLLGFIVLGSHAMQNKEKF